MTHLHLNLRSRKAISPDSSETESIYQNVTWSTEQTAILVCDMWDQHWCAGASRRVNELAPVMNEVLRAARARGVFIIHSPSGTLSFYEGTPARLLAQNAPPVPAPPGLSEWQSLDPSREPPLPIDDSDGGCDDEPPCPQHYPWTRQHAAIEIRDGDAVSDEGDEVLNLLTERGIENIIVMGVHTNMCVLGRPFGIRQLVKLGKNVALARDLTDTMYNPRAFPHVTHGEGTARVIAHIERWWCPTLTSDQIAGGSPFQFRVAEERSEGENHAG